MKTAILIYEGFTALDAIGPYEILSRIPDNKIMFVAKKKGQITSDTQMLHLVAEYELADISEADILLIPGGLSGTTRAMQDPEILAWVQSIHETTKWTTSACTGSLILAAAGLLKGLEATTHWAAQEILAKFEVQYHPHRYIQQGKILTAAGVSAGIDMALYLASQLVGEELAQVIQLATEYDPQPPFNAGSLEKADENIAMIAKQFLQSSF